MVIEIIATALRDHLSMLGTVMALEEVCRVGDAYEHACFRAFAALPPVPRGFVARRKGNVGTGSATLQPASDMGTRVSTPTASAHKCLSRDTVIAEC